MRNALACTILAFGLFGNAAAQEEAWPSRNVRFIIPYAAGSGAADAIGRIVAEHLHEEWRRPVVVENVPGASGSIGIGRLVREAPDGYTIAIAGDAPISVNVHLQKNISYDPLRDLRPIVQIGKAPNILVVHPESGPKSLAALIDVARKEPGKLSFRSTGVGTSQHIAIEMLKNRARIDVLHIPGTGSAAPDILGGHITGSFMNIPAALPHVQAGKLLALAQSGTARATGAPDIPTVAELGFPGFEASPWFGLFAPAKTPDNIAEQVRGAMIKALAEPAFRAKLVAIGLDVAQPATSREFAEFIRGEIQRMGEVVRETGMVNN